MKADLHVFFSNREVRQNGVNLRTELIAVYGPVTIASIGHSATSCPAR